MIDVGVEPTPRTEPTPEEVRRVVRAYHAGRNGRSGGPTAEVSQWETVARLSPDERDRWLRAEKPGSLEYMPWNWSLHSRPAQHPPRGAWRTWLLMAGRGYGKTRAGAEWVRKVADWQPDARIALVGATLHEARAVMVEGVSGLMSIHPPDERPLWEPSLRRLTWPNGAQAQLYSAAEPDALRGGEHSHAWADEVGKWPDGQAAWDMLAMTMRRGRHPKVVATTTPRPVPLIRRLVADPTVAKTVQPTRANRAHLAADFLQAMDAYAGTRLGRQELDGELIEELDGALWTRAGLEASRQVTVGPAVRTVVGVDPPASDRGDACGIVVAATDGRGRAVVLEDASVARPTPDQWAARVAEVWARHGADRVVVEANQGGEMVRTVLRSHGQLPVTLRYATKAKGARAEPVSLFYARGLVRHEGPMPELEDELCSMTPTGFEGPGRSPDRADALVWAVAELLLSARAEPSVRLL